MSKNISILENKIIDFINNNSDLNCIDLSLLTGLKANDFYMINTAIAAGADIYLDLEGNTLLDIVINHLEDKNIAKLFMNAFLEDAIRKKDYKDILFAIENGADVESYEIADFFGEGTNLTGNYDEIDEF